MTSAMRSVNGNAANETAVTAQEKTTIARCAPLASASQPHAGGAKVRASGASASTQAICMALNCQSARYSGK